MKFSVDIDCTPEEARRFLGLPDIAGLQEELMAELREKLRRGLDAGDPEAMFRAWMPAGFDNLERIRQAFWSNFPGDKRRE